MKKEAKNLLLLLLQRLFLVILGIADLNLVELIETATVAVVSKHVTHLIVSDSVGNPLKLSHWFFFIYDDFVNFLSFGRWLSLELLSVLVGCSVNLVGRLVWGKSACL